MINEETKFDYSNLSKDMYNIIFNNCIKSDNKMLDNLLNKKYIFDGKLD